jgi:hypothetical protein
MQFLYLPSGGYEDCVQCLEINVKSMGVLQSYVGSVLVPAGGK